MSPSLNSDQVPVRRSLMEKGFIALLICYWLLVYVSPATVDAARGSAIYVLFVGPALAFALFGGALIAWMRRVPARTLLLIVYIIVVCAVAAIRGDVPTITNTILTMLTVLVLTIHRLTPPPNLLNVLFLASIPLSAATYLAGYNIYGVIPGLSLDEELRWRISLFPVVPESAFFSAVVLILNILYKDLVLRRSCLVLAAYFLLFSGLRSALIGAALGLVYYFIVHRMWSWRPTMKMLYFGLASVAFVAALLASQAMLLLAATNSEFLNVYLFRSEGGIENEADLAKTIYRSWIWSEHLRLAAENPLFGIGTLDFAEMAIDEPVEGRVGSGSESFLTGLYARVGLPSLLFLGFLVASVWNGVKAGQHEQLMIGLLLVVAMLAYGSFLVPYNFVFLVMMACVCSSGHASTSAERAARYRVTSRLPPSGGLVR